MKLIKQTFFISALILSVAACGASSGGGPEAGNSRLTIVGDSNVFMDYGTVQTLTVRYHTNDDQPLAGQIDFRVVGSGQGASISKSFGVTNAEGIVQLQVTAGQVDTSFQIEASAQFAAPVSWTVAVTDGALPNLDPTGRYDVDSKFDIVSGLDNDVGNVLNDFIDMTDDPNDPATWIIDQLVDNLDDDGIEGLAKDGIQLTRGVIDPAVNEFILENVSVVNDIRDIGEQLGDVARNFGVNSTFDIRRVGQNDVDSSSYAAWHEVAGVNFEVQGEIYQFSMADMNETPIKAENIPVLTNAQSRLEISEHEMPLPYGSMLIIALEEVIIPAIDSDHSSLQSYLLDVVNCENVGEELEDSVGLLGSGAYESICIIGVQAGAAAILEQLRNVGGESGVTFTLTGTSLPRDTNGDRKVDQLSQGEWTGTIDYDGSPADLVAEQNTFIGRRSGN